MKFGAQILSVENSKNPKVISAVQPWLEIKDLLVYVLKFAKNPASNRVSKGFYHAQEQILREKYNQEKEIHRPAFIVDDTGFNLATNEQQKEVDFLLSKEEYILKDISNFDYSLRDECLDFKSIINDELVKLFNELRGRFKNIQPSQMLKFYAREKLIEQLNSKIIEQCIFISKFIINPQMLDCTTTHCLTRFPGKVILRNLEYFRKVEKFYVSNNKLQSLPAEINELKEVTELNINDNQIQYIPPQIGQLVSLQWLPVQNNKLQSLPVEIGDLKKLQYLNLENNQLQSLPDTLKENILYSSNFENITKKELLEMQKKTKISKLECNRKLQPFTVQFDNSNARKRRSEADRLVEYTNSIMDMDALPAKRLKIKRTK